MSFEKLISNYNKKLNKINNQLINLKKIESILQQEIKELELDSDKLTKSNRNILIVKKDLAKVQDKISKKTLEYNIYDKAIDDCQMRQEFSM